MKQVSVTKESYILFSTDAYPDAAARRSLLTEVGNLCLAQGSYQAAAKKFAQAGDMINVSGD